MSQRRRHGSIANEMYNRDGRTIVWHECKRGVYDVCVRLMVLETPRVLRLHCRSGEIVGVQRARRKGFVAVWNAMRALRAGASQGECKCFAPRGIGPSSNQHVHEAIIDGFVDIIGKTTRALRTRARGSMYRDTGGALGRCPVQREQAAASRKAARSSDGGWCAPRRTVRMGSGGGRTYVMAVLAPSRC